MKDQSEMNRFDNLKSRMPLFQPSLLLGNRDDFRFFEEAGKVLCNVLSFFIIGQRLMFWAIKDSEVAKSMFLVARDKQSGTHIYKPIQMMKLAKNYHT